MRNVGAHLLDDKMDEAVTHYINSHQSSEPVHVDTNGLSLNVQDEAGRVVTVMQTQGFSSHITRQVSVGEHVESGPWNEELMDPEMRLAALVAHLAHQSRTSHHQISSHHKVSSVRGDVESSVILDNTSMRLFNGQALETHTQSEPIVVQVPPLAPLPPLQDMKRCQDTNWYNKDKNTLKENEEILTTSDGPMLELSAVASPAQNKQNKKSLPHKKRISRRLKRTTFSATPQQGIIVVNCTDEVPQEEILPDNFVTAVQHQEHVSDETHHITQEVRPIFICQLCGEYYGEEQLKFYQHLKHHYEPPPATIIIENPVPDLGIDKMTNTCIVDNTAALPDSIVELTLESTVPKTMYQSIEKQHILYTTSDKALYTNKMQYTTASMDKEPAVPTSVTDKSDLYDSLDKLATYSCVKCNKYFRKQKQCEAHFKEAHSNPNPKLEDMGEFSEPEDLMEGIHVAVEEGSEQYESTLLPHLTVENGTVHQEHVRHWYMRSGNASGVEACGADGCCPVCPPGRTNDAHTNLKEEVLQRIFETEVQTDQNFAGNIIQEEQAPLPAPEPELEPEPPHEETPEIPEANNKKKKTKKCECPQCGRVFFHRNSLLYHMLSHDVRQHNCDDCGKSFYTPTALRIHQRQHNGQRPYKCEECPREFRQWSDLKYHKMSLHSDQKQFKCEFCSKEFARKYSLNLHRRIHTGEKNYKCLYCTKSFSASSYRVAHMRTHTGDRPYQCTQCEKSFRVVGDLRRHTIVHDKMRFRQSAAEHKPTDNTNNKETIKVEAVEKKTDQKVKKIAVASTARPPVLKNAEKKPKTNKKTAKKEGAPNVTVTTKSEQFKIGEYNNVEVFDARTEYPKVKQVYSEASQINVNRIVYKNSEPVHNKIVYDREMAILRPMFRGNEDKQVYTRAENSDGKLHVYTHVEKVGSVLSISDIRPEKTDLPGEGIENGFLENLTALYNIPAV